MKRQETRWNKTTASVHFAKCKNCSKSNDKNKEHISCLRLIPLGIRQGI